MILDSIKNISKYENLNIDLKSIVEKYNEAKEESTRIEKEYLESELDILRIAKLERDYKKSFK